jgi:hypothetical protein
LCVGRVQSRCPIVPVAIHRAKSRKGSARDDACISGGLGVGGVRFDDIWYLLEKRPSDVLDNDLRDHRF